MKHILAAATLMILVGCARFSTVQIDERTNAKTGEKTKITTKAASITFFDSKSSLAKWKASQTEKAQGAEVGGLSQESSATNVVRIVESAVEAAVKTAIKSVSPVPTPTR